MTYFADGAQGEAKRDPRSDPALLQDVLAALLMEHVTALELNGGSSRQGLREADHAHVVSVLLQRPLLAAVQTGQTRLFVSDAPAGVTTLQGAVAGGRGVILQKMRDIDTPWMQEVVHLAIFLRAHVSHRHQSTVAS